MAKKGDRYPKLSVRIAEGRSGHLAKCKNRELAWASFCKRLAGPPRSRESLKRYLMLPKEEQDRLKGSDGWVVGGPIENGWRCKANARYRDIITIDCDAITEHTLFEILNGFAKICRFEFVLHSTRKHTERNPRVRLFILLAEPMPADLYEPLTRILAKMIDSTLDGIDDVSFEAPQLMYWPTLCADSEYILHHNPGVPVDAHEVLESYPLDWHNFANLPYSELRSEARRKADKSENPLGKKGIIGAFCRAYDVETAIAEFLPGVYIPGDNSSGETRYTFAEGSVANGAIVYDDGLFLYSHNHTDPIGHQNVNAFDLVRIHKFGHEDEGKPNDTPVSKLPSFKAMKEWCQEQPSVTAQLVEERYDLAAMFDDLPDGERQAEVADEEDDVDDKVADLLGKVVVSDVPDQRRRKKPKKPKKGWAARELELDAQGQIKQTLYNAATLIANDPRLWGVIGYNAFSGKITARRSILSNLSAVPPIYVDDEENGAPWEDLFDYSVRCVLEAPAGAGKAGWSYKTSDRDVKQAIRLVSERWSFHPIKEYYESLTWDGEQRVERLWIDYLGLPDTPYARETARLFMIACVARIYCPGHKWDHVPIISGPQGIRKSSFLKYLFGDGWAGELTVEMASSKDSVEQMLGKQCLELPELDNMRRSEVTRVKSFITLTVDRVRLSYDARMKEFARQCVFVGTSNEDEYLMDRTGNRRFWPLPSAVDMIDTDRLANNRDQLWAEAYRLWREMCREYDWRRLPLMLKGKALREAERLQDMALEEDSTEATSATIEAWLDTPVPLSKLYPSDDPADDFDEENDPLALRVRTCPREAYCEALGFSLSEITRNKALETSAGFALATVKAWRKTGNRHRFPLYGRARLHVRRDATAKELAQGYRIVESDV